MKKAVIIFTRVPEAGKTKTRMMPHLTPEQCEKLHTCFLQDITGECRKCAADLFVCYTPEEGDQKLKKLLGETKGYFPQEGDGLGERMYRGLEQVLGLDYDACLLIGTDIPELKARDLERAFLALEQKDVVFGKTGDGGYYLVGMKRPLREVFSLNAYGHGKVLEETLRDLASCGISVGFTRTLEDMDTPEDLRGYRERMREDSRLKTSRTGHFLARSSKISVIIPVYNERAWVDRLQRQLLPLAKECEILFVDGGSTDGTVERIRPEFTLLHSEKGRGKQMNAGAKASIGDILFFLHCDSELPPRPLEQIRRVMRDYRAGCFGIAYHSRNFFMFTCRVISNHRIKDRKVMFGDQGIFVDRDVFFQAGMFPEIPIMEDYQFSLTLKKMGVKPGIARKRIYTSDRRYPKGTMEKLRFMWKMNRMRKMYRDGVSPEKLAKMYRDVR